MSRIFIGLFCTLVFTMSIGNSHAAGVDTTPIANAEDKNFVAGKKAIEAKKWAEAVTAFNKVVAADTKNADAYNYLGYANRWLNNMDESFKNYNTALTLDPNHLGAHEYIGVAYLKINQPEKANVHLAKLEKLCGKKCEEYTDLAKAIASYKPLKK